MARSLNDYSQLYLQLLPNGAAWSRNATDAIANMFTGLSEELVRIDARSEELILESLPSQSVELIDNHEQEWDLPGCCADTAETIDERHNVLANKLRGIENQSRQTFIDRAAQLGHTITVTEYAPGDVIPGHSYIPPADACFFIQINAAVGKVIPRHIGDEFGGAFNSWNKQQLECALQEIVLSHMTLIFSYS